MYVILVVCVCVCVCILFFADGCVVFTDLSDDETLFQGSGDYQFDIYRLMRQANKSVSYFRFLSQCLCICHSCLV